MSALIEDLDRAGLDQLLERWVIHRVVVDLPGLVGPQMEELAVGSGTLRGMWVLFRIECMRALPGRLESILDSRVQACHRPSG